MSGPKFQPGDIIRFLQPHVDSKGAASTHPGLVVGDPLNNINHDYVIAQITTTVWTGRTDVVVDAVDPEFAATGLAHGSTIRCHKIFPVAASAVRTRFGVAGPGIMAKVKHALRTALDL